MSLLRLLGKLWLRNSSRATKTVRGNPRRHYTPHLEILETRLAPATTINIVATGVGSLDAIFASPSHHGTILATDDFNQAETLSVAALRAASATENINIAAQISITFNDLGGTLALQTGSGHSDTFSAAGAITFSKTANKLSTNGGALNFFAGADLTVANLSAGGGGIDLVAGTIAEGSVSAEALLTSGTGNVTIQATNAAGPSDTTQFGQLTGHTVNVTATGSVTVDQVKGTSVTLTSNTGSIDSAGANAIQSSGLLTLNAASGITINSLAATLQASNTTSGDIFVTQVASPIQPLTTAGSGIVNDASGGTIAITNLGSAITVAVGAPIVSFNGSITLLATDFTILNTIDSGTATTTLGNAKAGTPFDLGTNNVAGKISLTQAELQFVTASLLRIGTPTAGAIVISQPIVVPASVNGDLHLSNNGAITESTAPGVGSLTATDLAISSAGPVTLSNVNDVADLASSTTGSFLINNGTNTLIVPNAGIDGVAGVFTNNSNITLEADNILINQEIAPSFSSNTTNTVLLEPFTTTLNITLGTASVANATFGLTDLALGWIASGITKIGVGADTGTIMIAAAISRTPTSGAGRSQTLFLVTGNTSLNPLRTSTTGAINQLPGATVSVANLATQSVGGVQLGNDFNNVDTIAGDVTGATINNNFRFQDIGNSTLTVGTVAGVAGITVASGNYLEVSTLGALTFTSGLHGNVIGLNAVGTVTQASGAGAAITGGTLLLLDTGLGAGPVTLTDAQNNVNTLMANATYSVSYTNAGNLAIGSLFTNFADGFGGTAGIAAASGAIAVNTVNGNLTLTGPVAAGGVGSNVTLTAGDPGTPHTTLTDNTDITGATATLVADRMILNGGTINVGTAAADILALQPVSAGRTINVGGTGYPIGTLEFSQADLATITSGILRIGSSTAGNLTVAAAINGVGNFNTLTLLTHGVIAQTGAGAVTVTNLDAFGAGGVALATNANTVSGVLAGSTANQNFAFTNSTTLALGTTDTESGVSAGAASVTLRANGSAIFNDVAVGSAVTAGTVTVNGRGGIGTGLAPLTLAVNKVTTLSNAAQFLSEIGTATIIGSGLNAGTSDVVLTGGTFALSANNQIPTASTLAVSGATLNLGTFSNTVAGFFNGNSNSFDVRMNAFSAGDFGALTVNGTISLGNATLNLTFGTGFVKPAVGKTIVLIRNPSNVAVQGEFAGLAEGATVTVGAFKFGISYVGGARNNVTLTAL